MRKLFLILSVFLSVQMYAQQYSTKSKRAIEYFHKALEAYNSYNYKEAVYWSKEALDKDKKFIEVYYLLSDVYDEVKRPDLKIAMLKKAVEIKPDKSALAWYTLAKTELSIGKYAAAKGNFEQVKKYDKQKQFEKKVDTYIKKCDFGIEAMQKPVEFNPLNLGKNINSEFNEYLPSLTADEQTLIFTRLVPEQAVSYNANAEKQEDFYYAQEKEGVFMPAKSLGKPLNTFGNEGAQSISADGQLLFFTSCEYEDGKSAHGYTFGSCDIFVSHKEGDKWGTPKNLGKTVNSSYWESQPSFSADGKTLYFASNRPGGIGGMDIWKTSMNKNGSWTKPVNLGEPINTEKHEQSPFIHFDNRTLYFSSNGHLGMGKQDLFLSRKDSSGKWQTPENLGYPINTFDEEVSLVINTKGNTGYFASSKKSEFGGMDLYRFKMPPQKSPQAVSYVQGIIYDKETGEKLSSAIRLINIHTKKEAAIAYSDQTSGKYLVCLPAGKDYAFNVSKKGYLFFSENFSLSNLTDSLQVFNFDIPLSPLKKGEKIILKNIFFDTDSYELKPTSFVELENILDFLQNNPGIKIEISGHTDNTGNEAHNKQLSFNRANSVYKYLIKNKINKERLSCKGYGSSKPISQNNTEEGKQKNRRTEFKIM